MAGIGLSKDSARARRSVSRAEASRRRSGWSAVLGLVVLAALLAVAAFVVTGARRPFAPESIPYLSIQEPPSADRAEAPAPAKEAVPQAIAQSRPVSRPGRSAASTSLADAQTIPDNSLAEDAAATGFTARRTAEATRNAE